MIVLRAACLLLACLAAPGDGEEPLSEKALREAFKKAYARSDPELRAAAVSAYDEGTRALDDSGTSRLVARTLASALEDDDLEVRGAALAALAWGRDPDATIDAVEEAVQDLRNEVEKAATRPDEASRERYRQAVTLYQSACQLLGRYKDDRCVDILASELRTLRATGLSPSAASLVGPLAEGLLALASHDAVEAVIKQTNVFSGEALTDERAGRSRLVAAERLHAALAAFAEGMGQAPPSFSATYDQDWRDWFKQHEDALATRLGKLSVPPPVPAYEPPDRRPSRRRPGEAERP